MMIEIYTDGSCKKNPGGSGTCAFVVVENGEKTHEQFHFRESTTNNRMELMAILASFLFIKSQKLRDDIIVYTDSIYACNGVNKWMEGWSKKNWLKKGEDIPNRDIWQHIHQSFSSLSNVKVEWVKGHADNKWNNYTDELCTLAYTFNKQQK